MSFPLINLPVVSSMISSLPSQGRTQFSDVVCRRTVLDGGSRVIEVGSRDGVDASRIAKETGAFIVGVEEDTTLVRKAIRSQRTEVSPSARTMFFSEKPEKLPFQENSFDLAYCSRIENTANDLEELIDAMIRIVRPKGRIVVSSIYLFRELADCPEDVKNWLGEDYFSTHLGDLISKFEERGLVLDHFEPLHDALAAHVESLVWDSLLESGTRDRDSWGSPLSYSSASSVLRAIDERKIGYAAMVFDMGDKTAR